MQLVELNYDLTRKSAGLFLIWSRLEEITMYVESGDMDPLIREDPHLLLVHGGDANISPTCRS